MTDTNRRVQDILNRFVAELTQVAREEAASYLLGGLSTPRTSKRGTSEGRGAKRSPESLVATKEKLIAFVTKHPGLRTEEINRQLGTSTKELALPMRQLVAEKRLRTTGHRRATKYFAGGVSAKAVPSKAKASKAPRKRSKNAKR